MLVKQLQTKILILDIYFVLNESMRTLELLKKKNLIAQNEFIVYFVVNIKLTN